MLSCDRGNWQGGLMSTTFLWLLWLSDWSELWLWVFDFWQFLTDDFEHPCFECLAFVRQAFWYFGPLVCKQNLDKLSISSLMKKQWRNIVSFLLRHDVKWSGVTSIILLYFISRDLMTIKYLVSNYGRKRVDKTSGKDNHDRKSDSRWKDVETNKKSLQVRLKCDCLLVSKIIF